MRWTIAAAFFPVLLLGVPTVQAKPDEMPWVAVSKDKKGFVLEPSGRPFMPWGFNYDHDDKGRLIEDYWEDEWPTVEAHFGQMKKLGANVVRIHLQLGKFMDGPDKPNGKALDRLGKLLGLAEKDAALPRPDRPGLLPQEGRARLVRQALREGPLGRAGPLLAGGGGPLRRQPRRLLLRPDERAGGARRQGERTAIGWGLPSPASTSSSSSRWTRQTGPGPTSPGSGFTTWPPPSGRRTSGT